MALPFFYIPTYDPAVPELTLDEDNSRHVIQVLRMRPGEALRLTDGQGHLLTAVILDDHKKKCRVAIRSADVEPPRATEVTIAISPLKNASRFEWFLEKATEIGVDTIIPLLCERTERPGGRTDRLQQILISAMLQSQQSWMPRLQDPTPFAQVIRMEGPPTGPGGHGRQPATRAQCYIAHCLEAPAATQELSGVNRIPATGGPDAGSAASPGKSRPEAGSTTGPEKTPTLILIGPEGDFTSKEVETALTSGFMPVSLGRNRLRTETAGIVAATLLCLG